MSKTAGLQVGDVIEVTYRLPVDAVLQTAFGPQEASIKSYDERWYLGFHGITDIRTVVKAKRKVREGDTLTGAEVRERQWKRGTMFVGEYHEPYFNAPGMTVTPGQHFLLTADGTLLHVEKNQRLSFGNVYDDELLTVAYLP